MVSWWRFELQTDRLEGDCSIQLSYQDISRYKWYHNIIKKSTTFAKKVYKNNIFLYNFLRSTYEENNKYLNIYIYNTFSFSLFLIYYSIFSSNKIKKLLNDYYDKKYLYTMNKVFKCSILLIIILTMLLGVISYIISTLINIEKLYLVNITMTIFLSISLIIKLINNYLNIFGYKKNILLNIYKLSSLI